MQIRQPFKFKLNDFVVFKVYRIVFYNRLEHRYANAKLD